MHAEQSFFVIYLWIILIYLGARLQFKTLSGQQEFKRQHRKRKTVVCLFFKKKTPRRAGKSHSTTAQRFGWVSKQKPRSPGLGDRIVSLRPCQRLTGLWANLISGCRDDAKGGKNKNGSLPGIDQMELPNGCVFPAQCDWEEAFPTGIFPFLSQNKISRIKPRTNLN